MCAVYGFLNYGHKVSNKLLKNILRELSIAAECRGTDATGISYVNNGEIVTFKQPKPAHKMKLFFPKDTVAVIGHNRLTTQGSEKKNFNNHPFVGMTAQHSFALAHNGVLYNDKEIRLEKQLPKTQIETDSYIAAQLLEQSESVSMDSVKNMAETVDGSFVFTILRNDNMLFLVKGSNPIVLYYFLDLGLYIYASTKEIMKTALKNAGLKESYDDIKVNTGDIIQINSDGKIFCDTFETLYHFDWHGLYSYEESEDDLLAICNCFGIDREDVVFLYSCGYTSDEIEEMLFDAELFEETLNEVKALSRC